MTLSRGMQQVFGNLRFRAHNFFKDFFGHSLATASTAMLEKTINAMTLQNVGDAVETVSEYEPLLGAIVILLLAAIVALTTALVYVHKLYREEHKNKEDQINKLNAFIRASYKESTAAIGEMVHVMDVQTRTTQSVSDDVRSELREFTSEIRTHISTLQNLPSFVRSQMKHKE